MRKRISVASFEQGENKWKREKFVNVEVGPTTFCLSSQVLREIERPRMSKEKGQMLKRKSKRIVFLSCKRRNVNNRYNRTRATLFP